jgi:ribosomal protein L37AE/L43A
MPIRPEWSDDYWKSMDKETARKIRTRCPRCGSTKTYYNKQYKVWRCGACENSFKVKGYGERWYDRLMFWRK